MDQLLLSAACTSFGRNSAMCDVTLDHQSLSRKHALLCYNSHSVLCLCDLNSTHGTFLNGERVPGQQPLTLQEGDVLTFGASTRQYVVEKASTAAARASIPAPSEKEEEDFGPPLPPPPSASAQAAQGPGAGTGSSSSRSSMGPPPAPETIKFGSMGPPPAPSLNKEAERAELQAAIASMSQPVQYAQHTAGPAGQQLDKEEGGFEEEGEEEEGEGGGMPGLPTSFVTRKVVGSAGSGAARGGAGAHKRPRPQQQEEAVQHEEESSDEDEFGPSAPPSALPRGPQRPLSSADLAHAMGLPVSHEAELGGGSKAVVAVAFDPAGGRLATGSADYSLRLYDFGGMDRGHKPFRDVTPHEGQPVRALAWTPSGDRIAVATAAANVKVFDREGRQQVATIKGDMYISDAVNTKGHQAGVTWVAWLPPQGAHGRPTATLLSGSQDGTIRMWDLTNGKKIFEELCCSDVIKFKSVRGVKCGVTCAAVEPLLSGGGGGEQQGARFVVAGLEDGSIHVVHFKAPGFRYTRSDVTLRDAHGGQRGAGEAGGPGGAAAITCLAFSPDGSLLASRGMDGCVRVWRVYKAGSASTLALSDRSAPLASISGLPCTHDSANVAWSPDGRLLLVGTSVQGTARGAGEGEASTQTAPGCVVVLDVASSERACSRGSGDGSEGGRGAQGDVPADTVAVFKVSLAERTTAVQVAWHPKLNQIAVSCSTGLVKVLYSPSLSVKGALLSSARAVKSRDTASDYYAAESVGTIYLPNALPMFSEDAGPLRGPSKKQRAEEMARTAVPPSGGGAGPAKPVDLAAPLPGAVPEYLTHAKRTFTEYFMQHAVKEGPGSERNLRAEDPQVVLTQYAARSAAGHARGAPEVALYTRVYAATQPQAVLATKTLEEERDEWEKAQAARLKAAQGGQQK